VLLVRIGRRARWQERSAGVEADVREAAKDLTLRDGETGLSVYRVSNREEARDVALGWALEKRDRDDHVDYLLVNEVSVTETHALTAVPDEEASDSRLRMLHCELTETVPDASRALARKLLASGLLGVERISRTDVESARRAARDDGSDP
jgi:hypothetical protein